MAETTKTTSDKEPLENDTNIESKEKTVSINRLGIGTLAVVQIAFALISVILLNYLSCTNHKRLDLSQNADFSLSSTTTQFLTGENISKRPTPIKFVAVLKQSSPYYLRLRAQLENYERQSNNNIKLEFVDPIRDPDRTQEVSTTYQRNLSEEIILIDARSETLDSETSKKDAQLDLATHVRSVPVKSLFIEEIDRFNERFISTWRDEDLLTSYLLSAIEGKPRRFYFIVDKSQIDAKTQGTPAWKTYQQLLLSQNIQLIPLKIAETQSVPDDAEGLALIGPSFDFDDREIETLRQYWDRNSAAIFITLDPSAKLINLRRFLREYGITPQDDRVISTENGQTLTSTRAFFNQGPLVNRELAFKSTQLDGATASLEVLSDNDRLNIKNIRPFPLIQASEGWWGETKYLEPNPTFDPQEDKGSTADSPRQVPVHIAAAVVRGLENDDRTSPLTSRMIVIGNTEFLKPDNMREELTYFVNSSINWLVGREDLIGIGPKPVNRQKITLLSAHKSFIDQIILIYLPVFSLFIALVLWNSRRS